MEFYVKSFVKYTYDGPFDCATAWLTTLLSKSAVGRGIELLTRAKPKQQYSHVGTKRCRRMLRHIGAPFVFLGWWLIT